MSVSLHKSFARLFVSIVLGAVLLLNSSVRCEAYSGTVDLTEDAYNTLLNGTTVYNGVDYGAKYGYNPLYYFLNYNDLRIAYGANPAKLVEHYAIYGLKENRVANTQITRGAHSWGSSTEYIVPSYQLTSNQRDGMVVIPDELHNNGGMNRRQDTEARSVAKQLATNIYNTVMAANNSNNNNRSSSNNTTTTIPEIEMVAYATGIVQAYCNAAGPEMTRADVARTNSKVYRTAYGVFCAHEYTSAGATRALGLILDYLNDIIQQNNPGAPPLKWRHMNANTWNLQYCQVLCNNHEAYADAINGIAGYGKHPQNGGVEQDIQTYVSFATLSQIMNTRPPVTDINERSKEDLPKNRTNGSVDDYNIP